MNIIQVSSVKMEKSNNIMSPEYSQEDDDSNFEEVALEKKQQQPTVIKQKSFFQPDNRALEGMMGGMFRRLSTGTKVLTQSISQSLQTECISKPEAGTGISRRQSLIMSNFIGKLENEEVDDDDDFSVVTETSEFVGARRNCKPDSGLPLFRHQLSTCQSFISSETEEQYFLSPEAEYQEDPAIEQSGGNLPNFGENARVDAPSTDTAVQKVNVLQ
eukprot:CAMPEP_0119004090 /NCGR_PEP_ID=MMETSP1176-20130426/948_1 /TAXON_ID=265551 /ORGANISM="Synedropsis recta cf, Strain CCMP1620" /LENGTH=215 /DNA_ID=CAMNT_0006955761 /DNA_START=89 /DNA_END=736 /DNA_ORIENTATION=+